jgi:dihydroorotate dehydrogenase (fumarate)
MDLSTRYLGFTLPHPIIAGASPLSEDLDMVLRLEDAGAAAIVMHSLFEEDVIKYGLRPDEYLEHLLRVKRRVHVPVIASLNGTSAEGWLYYARLIERAGADAIELNFYHIAADADEDGPSVERRVIDIVAVLKESIALPLAVKLSPFYSSLPHLASRLDQIGADGLVLFNRFYQPDIDPEHVEAAPVLRLSDSSELLLRLRWIAILSGRIEASLAASGGVHEPIDAVKAVLAGADCVQVVSALLKYGPGRLTEIRHGLARWADDHGYDAVRKMRGLANLARCSRPDAFERGNYVRMLRSWQPTVESIVGH